ncbi:hypothetical protein [uncultured Faecalicoccus sp.]|uniref:hypothetical protein n=1 Tax=uncultured Faecalicoccus sp. TaxID=1971760 RepID=UPI002584F620|nr:hypothetical protein [uncultured Faecalicoccus sp.]
MVITNDILLRGTAWNIAISELGDIFSTRTHYSLFMLSLSIGIMYDKRIESPVENGEDVKSVPRNVLNNNDNGKLDFYFQAAILSTQTEDLTEEKRLELAFGEKTDFNKITFLLSFANFGVEKLVEKIGTTPIESMENIKNFMVSTVEGQNFDIDELSIEDVDFFGE